MTISRLKKLYELALRREKKTQPEPIKSDAQKLDDSKALLEQLYKQQQQADLEQQSKYKNVKIVG